MITEKLFPEEYLQRFLETERKVNEIHAWVSKQTTEVASPHEVKVRTLPEASNYVRMAEPTFRQYLRNGQITGSRLGKRWLFTQDDLDRFLKRYLVPSVEDLKEQGRLS